VGTVTYTESSVTLPTYPYWNYQIDAVDPKTGWPFQQFNRERFLTDNPAPVPRTYRTLIMENAYLRLTLLPELGGRLWQAEHKASGNRMFYQNAVVKPSPWGPGNQLGWLALGGLEWDLPVIEHGYEWGAPWDVQSVQQSDARVAITLAMPQENRPLEVSVTIALRAGQASFTIEPRIANRRARPYSFDYWHTAMLAPGSGNSPSADLRFVLPDDQMMVHSTGDPTLPPAQQPFTWPMYKGQDWSRLGNWARYLGFFEYPAAQGPFAGVYDGQYDAGAVRVYPAAVARGSKAFGLGWTDALPSSNYTDDGSAYVELHGGLAPSFFEQSRLAAGESVTWREAWYPVQAIGGLTFANDAAAIHVEPSAAGLQVGFYPTRPMEGTLVVAAEGAERAQIALRAHPNAPFRGLIVAPTQPPRSSIQVRFEDGAGRVLLEYTVQ